MNAPRAAVVSATVALYALVTGCAGDAQTPGGASGTPAPQPTEVTDGEPGDLLPPTFRITGGVTMADAPVESGTLIAALETTQAHCGRTQVAADGSFQMTVTSARVPGGGPQCAAGATLLFLYHARPGETWQRAQEEVTIDFESGTVDLEITLFPEGTPLPSP